MARRRKKPGQTGRIGRRAAYRVFVSHASADKWIAKVLCEKIDAVGAITFRDDRDVASGDDIPEGIRKEIIRSQEMVMLLTPESVDRPWVLLEAGAFWARRKNARIVAVLCHAEFDRIPNMIKSKKAISINEFDEYLGELRVRLK